jgi:hypothetical protein
MLQIARTLPLVNIYKLFGLRNDLVHHLLTLYFFVWFVEWIELIHHHLIPYSYLVSSNMRIEIIPPNLRNGPMMHHHILDEVIPQTKHPYIVYIGLFPPGKCTGLCKLVLRRMITVISN